MQDSYDKVKEREAIEGLREKALTIVAMELLHPSQHVFPMYMHIAEPESDIYDSAGPQATRDNGMGGRIANNLAASTNERIAALETRAAERELKLQAELEEMKAMLAQLLERDRADTYV
jgi:hypothetical protein